jgi:PPOX class probable F420-dependent enzyme
VFYRMTGDEAIKFLGEGTRTGKLATADPDGDPHVAPVWFVMHGGDLVFTTRAQSVKGRNLLANPRASVAVDDEEFPYHFVMVRGTVDVVQGAADLLAWTTRIASRYLPADRVDAFAARNAVPDELLCRLRPQRIHGRRNVAG